MLISEERIRRVDLAQSASLKNVAPNSFFQIEDYICGIEKISLS